MRRRTKGFEEEGGKKKARKHPLPVCAFYRDLPFFSLPFCPSFYRQWLALWKFLALACSFIVIPLRYRIMLGEPHLGKNYSIPQLSVCRYPHQFLELEPALYATLTCDRIKYDTYTHEASDTYV